MTMVRPGQGPNWKDLTDDSCDVGADGCDVWPEVGMRAMFIVSRPVHASWNPPSPMWVPRAPSPMFAKTRHGTITKMLDGLVVEFTADDGFVFDPSVDIDSLVPEVPSAP